jgi:hypothetical protein
MVMNHLRTKIRSISKQTLKKLFLLFFFCIVVGLLLSIRTRITTTLTLVCNGQVVPPGDEHQQLIELKRKMADTMSEMELQASELQQKLNKKLELSKSNAEMGIKRVALEYKVVELEVDLPYPSDHEKDPFFTNLEVDDEDEAQELVRKERVKERMKEGRKFMKNLRLEARRQCREFETTKLKELGEDGWTLQSIDGIYLPDEGVIDERGWLQKSESFTNVYYFSRPL